MTLYKYHKNITTSHNIPLTFFHRDMDYRTPTKSPRKKLKRLDFSVVQKSDTMFNYAKKQNDDLKAEVKELMKRLLIHGNSDALNDVILKKKRFLKVYDLFLETVKAKKVPLIVLSDFNTPRWEF